MIVKDIKKLDRIWSAKVREIGHCESCLADYGQLAGCHIKGRRHRNTRWGAWIDGKYDLCGFCGCVVCHQDYDEHGTKHDFIKRVVVGQDRYDKIQKVSQVIAKNQDFEQIKGWINGI